MIHYIEEKQLTTEIFKSNKLILVEFFIKNSIPCEMQYSRLKEIEKKYSEDVEMFRIDVYESQTTQIRYDISSMPTIIFFKNGQELDRQIGNIEEEKIIQTIKDLI